MTNNPRPIRPLRDALLYVGTVAIPALTLAVAFTATATAPALTHPPVPSSAAPTSIYLPACETEDSRPMVGCVWLAEHQGNGLGQSFIVLPSPVYVDEQDYSDVPITVGMTAYTTPYTTYVWDVPYAE